MRWKSYQKAERIDMARAAKSRVVVETETEPGLWKEKKNGFKTIPQAEEWIKEHINFEEALRIAKVSGVFVKQAIIAKK
jgi:hypothetical protein